MKKPNIEIGTKQHAEAIFQLIHELAEYENAPNEVTLSFQDFVNDGWGPQPRFETLIALVEGKVVGFMLFYPRYSTWKGPTLYLEDFVIKSHYRKMGIGTQLFKVLKRIAHERNVARLEWQVLDWNSIAIEFYKKHKARIDEEWLNVQFTKEDLKEIH